jgi:hypothetical protein
MTNHIKEMSPTFYDDIIILHKELGRKSKKIIITKYFAPLKDFIIIKLKCNGAHMVKLD